MYLHIYFHLKTSDDLEVYDIEKPSKDKLEEICDLRQPVRFNFNDNGFINICNRSNVLDIYGAFDVKIRDTKKEVSDDEEIYVPLPLNNALKALNEDKDNRYILESNREFLDETGLIKEFRYYDAFIRPYMVSSCDYDFVTASNKVRTQFKYDLNYRNYYFVTEGSIIIKLAPPKSSKYLNEIKDYDNFEFRSPVNPWNVQKQYKADFDKVKCLEIKLLKGQILFIPAFWWYSIEFAENTTMGVFKYRTYMNAVAITPQIFMSFLQSQNIKRNIVPKMVNDALDMSNSDTEENTEENTEERILNREELIRAIQRTIPENINRPNFFRNQMRLLDPNMTYSQWTDNEENSAEIQEAILMSLDSTSN